MITITINENMGRSRQYRKQNPSNTTGFGNPAFPISFERGNIGNTGKDFHNQKPGSGDLL